MPEIFSEEGVFRKHIRATHQDFVAKGHLSDILTACKTYKKPILDMCPVCSMYKADWKKKRAEDVLFEQDADSFLDHIGKCMHDFALWALPSTESNRSFRSASKVHTDISYIDSRPDISSSLTISTSGKGHQDLMEANLLGNLDSVSVSVSGEDKVNDSPSPLDVHGLLIETRSIVALTSDLPRESNDTFERILNGSPDPKKCKQLLHLVLGAKRPLSLVEMSIALAFDDKKSWDGLVLDFSLGLEKKDEKIKADIENICPFLVNVVEDKVYLLHHTMREFLVQSDSLATKKGEKPGLVANSWQFSFHLTTSNSILAEICISYLHMDIMKVYGSFFEYSALFWAYHYRRSDDTCRRALAEKAQYLCSKEGRTKWARFYESSFDFYARWDYITEMGELDPINGSPIGLAAHLGLEEVVELFLHEDTSTKTDIDSKDTNGPTPLFYAANDGHDAVVKLLLGTASVGANLRDLWGQASLLYAAKNGHEAVVKLLLRIGNAEVDAKDERGRTSLFYAVENRHEAMVKLLITSKADVNAKDTRGRTPLVHAAENGHEAMVKLLITSNADIDAKNIGGRTPLFYAAEKGHEAIVKLLITSKADIDAKDTRGRTPLFYAAEKGHEAIVKLLITSKADIDAKDTGGQTPLLLAAGNGHNGVVEQLLLTSNAGIDSSDQVGQTPLLLAAEKGHNGVFKLLLLHGANPELEDKDGRRAIQRAIDHGHNDIVMMMINAKVCYDLEDGFKRTLLHRAARNGKARTLKLLLENCPDLDINARGDKGETALHDAVEQGHISTCQVLVGFGARTDIKDGAGRTARQVGHPQTRSEVFGDVR